MKPNFYDGDIDKKRQMSLSEFKKICDELREHLSQKNPTVPEHILKKLIEEGQMILSAVLLSETVATVSFYEQDKKCLPVQNFSRLLHSVKHYCNSVTTMKFPEEWEKIITSELPQSAPEKIRSKREKPSSPRGVSGSPLSSSPGSRNSPTTPGSPQMSKRDLDKSQVVTSSPKVNNSNTDAHKEASTPAKKNNNNTNNTTTTTTTTTNTTAPKPEEQNTEGDEEDEDGAQTVQIEIRGNTGGFVGSVIEFDLVVSHEDGSPVEVEPDAFEVEISGPAKDSKVSVVPKVPGSFRIEFVPNEAGPNMLSVFLHGTLLTSGIKSIISKAGEVAFLLHAKDISKGQLQGTSVVPLGLPPKDPTELLKKKLKDLEEAKSLIEDLINKSTKELRELENNNTHEGETSSTSST
eukprot:TRINITY_DN366_c0_g1_i6.p1 TRINITY_DN366_c0_g1~~TRINITY_DN366_c0_g1_i6.p1  ORF type:complete len:407 (-),score=99.65 TRINITY_DN366_c0_g1_i6:3-1223(-)